jgi:crotonobetainyl-CoA:carnitine CoA-transferase CaiB-like acyl-CoA transferase
MANLFSDLKVLDVASFIAGPAATTILSDFGADVIKVEPPGTGDPVRYLI